jgi:hypothetical protein
MDFHEIVSFIQTNILTFGILCLIGAYILAQLIFSISLNLSANSPDPVASARVAWLMSVFIALVVFILNFLDRIMHLRWDALLGVAIGFALLVILIILTKKK